MTTEKSREPVKGGRRFLFFFLSSLVLPTNLIIVPGSLISET